MQTFLHKNRALVPLSLLVLCLFAGRIILSGSCLFGFLLKNIFLAYMPLYFSHRLRRAQRGYAAFLWAGLWLLFFPNTAYLVTDLFHLYVHERVPLWYDLLLLFSAALCGLTAGFLSLRELEQWLSSRIGNRKAAIALPFIMLLSGFGIYLGRYVRWNSWDLFVKPVTLVRHVGGLVFHPTAHAWAISTVFGVWMYCIYIAYKKWQAYETR